MKATSSRGHATATATTARQRLTAPTETAPCGDLDRVVGVNADQNRQTSATSIQPKDAARRRGIGLRPKTRRTISNYDADRA